MARKGAASQTVNIFIIAQNGRLMFEAVLFAASFARNTTTKRFKLWVAVPQPGPLWQEDPRLSDPALVDLLTGFGATILPFETQHFGQAYPYGNKIEAMRALPAGEPFVFFDTDTLLVGDLNDVPFDFDRPSASMKREGTWPEIELYGPGYTQTWRALYDRFDLDFESSLDLSWPDEYWQRYLYFNAGFFFYKCPRLFGQRMLDYALDIRDNTPPELICQSLDPWLDQVALPLVIHSFGGGRDTLAPGYLDGSVSCHYRTLPLLYAREPDRVVDTLTAISSPHKVKKVLKTYDVFKRMIYHGRGDKVRALFDRDDLPKREKNIRNRLKKEGYWMR